MSAEMVLQSVHDGIPSQRVYNETLDSNARGRFSESLGQAQELLLRQGIDFRIIGSLGSASYIDPDGLNLNFNRSNAISLDQKVPDVDLIVPKHDLPAARYCREQLLHTNNPIKLGLYAAVNTVDYHPDDGESYLHHNSFKVPIPTSTFQPVKRSLLGVEITTVDANTQLHTYETFGGRLRKKDIPVRWRLANWIMTNDSDEILVSEEDCIGFHTFIEKRISNIAAIQ